MQLTNPTYLTRPDGNVDVFVNCSECNKEFICVVPLTAVQARMAGALVHEAFPMLTPEQRELFFMSGMCPGCWKKLILDPSEERD